MKPIRSIITAVVVVASLLMTSCKDDTLYVTTVTLELATALSPSRDNTPIPIQVDGVPLQGVSLGSDAALSLTELESGQPVRIDFHCAAETLIEVADAQIVTPARSTRFAVRVSSEPTLTAFAIEAIGPAAELDDSLVRYVYRPGWTALGLHTLDTAIPK